MSKSMVARIVIAVVVVLGILGYNLFFVDSGEVGKFSDKLVDTVAQANSRFEPFSGHLQRYFEGAEVNVELMAQARDDLEKNIKGDHDLLKQITVPEDELCGEFHSGCLAYVENSVQLVEKYKEAIDYISKHNPGNEADVKAVAVLLARLGARDEELLEDVGESQKKMAKKFDLTLK
jgi:hypothetical protein